MSLSPASLCDFQEVDYDRSCPYENPWGDGSEDGERCDHESCMTISNIEKKNFKLASFIKFNLKSENTRELAKVQEIATSLIKEKLGDLNEFIDAKAEGSYYGDELNKSVPRFENLCSQIKDALSEKFSKVELSDDV